jgi:apolipoprotein N-acyltransferase
MNGPRAGARAYALVIASGVALSFAFPEPDLAPLAWLAFIPALYVLRRGGFGGRFSLGFVFGASFFGPLLYWISIVGWVAWGGLVVLQAFFIGAFGFVYGRIAARSEYLRVKGSGGVVRVLAAAVLWVSFEYLRSIVPTVGFTWGEIAQSQHNVPWVLRYASLGGGWLVAFVVVAFNALLLETIEYRRRGSQRTLGYALAGVAILVLPLAIPVAHPDGPTVKAAIVQGNVPRSFSGTPLDKEKAIIASHVALTEGLVDESPDLVVWPESSLGLDMERFPDVAQAVTQAATKVNAPMIVGGNLDLPNGNYLVMAFEISPDGEITDRYQKTHLVPFGEYVPLRGLLGRIPMIESQVPRDAEPGPEGVLFDVAGGKVAPVISFEGDFGSLVQRRINLGGQLLVVATNTSTWNFSWTSAQHVALSQVRAAENGVWVVHAALSGISAFISPEGEVVARSPLYEATTLVHEVSFATSATPYARFGDWVPLLCLLAAIALFAATMISRNKTYPKEVTTHPDGA